MKSFVAMLIVFAGMLVSLLRTALLESPNSLSSEIAADVSYLVHCGKSPD
jgi:hypothetical protein